MKHTIRLLALAMALLLTLTALAACAEDTDGGDAYYISYNDVKIQPGANAKGLLDKLGEPDYEKNNGNCGGQGVQMKYSYTSFDLYLLEATDGTLTVDQITLKDDLMETPEGIAIGDAKTDVEQAYGTPDETNAYNIVYRSGRQELIFGMEDGRVESIDIIYRTTEA